MDDVLSRWSPVIDWGRFEQRAISDEMWRYFKQLVQLCHAFRHWEEEIQNKKASPPRHFEFPPENEREYKNRRNQWNTDIRQNETYMHRAGHLAADTLARMSYLIKPNDEGKPDWKLYFALRALRGAVVGPPQPRWGAAAFEAFDANRELEGKFDEIAERWLRQVG